MQTISSRPGHYTSQEQWDAFLWQGGFSEERDVDIFGCQHTGHMHIYPVGTRESRTLRHFSTAAYSIWIGLLSVGLVPRAFFHALLLEKVRSSYVMACVLLAGWCHYLYRSCCCPVEVAGHCMTSERGTTACHPNSLLFNTSLSLISCLFSHSCFAIW